MSKQNHYFLTMNIRNVAPDGFNIGIKTDVLATREEAAAVGLGMGRMAETIIIKEEG